MQAYLGINRSKWGASGQRGLQILATSDGLAGVLLAVRVSDVLVVLHQRLQVRHTAHTLVLSTKDLGAWRGVVAVGLVDVALGGHSGHEGDFLEVRVVVARPVRLALWKNMQYQLVNQ